MLSEKKHARVAVTLIICAALLMLGGVSPVSGETLYEPAFEERVYEPAFEERVYEPAFEERVYEPAFEERVYESAFEERVYEPAFEERVYEPAFGERDIFLRGRYALVEQENVAYLRCAKLEVFNKLLKCTRDALGMTQEKIDKAVGEYVKAAEEGNRQWK